MSITTMATSDEEGGEERREKPEGAPRRSPIPGVEEAAGAALAIEDVLLRILG